MPEELLPYVDLLNRPDLYERFIAGMQGWPLLPLSSYQNDIARNADDVRDGLATPEQAEYFAWCCGRVVVMAARG